MSEKSTTHELVNIIEERNETIRLLREETSRLWHKVDFLMKNFIKSEEGVFTFHDGDTWTCMEAEETE